MALSFERVLLYPNVYVSNHKTFNVFNENPSGKFVYRMSRGRWWRTRVRRYRVNRLKTVANTSAFFLRWRATVTQAFGVFFVAQKPITDLTAKAHRDLGIFYLVNNFPQRSSITPLSSAEVIAFSRESNFSIGNAESTVCSSILGQFNLIKLAQRTHSIPFASSYRVL